MAGNSDVEEIANGQVNAMQLVQDPEERRVLRTNYRQLIEKTQSAREDPSSCSLQDLDVTLQEARGLYNNVKMPREAAYDSELLSLLSAVGKQKAQMMQTNLCEFDLMNFGARLNRFISLQRREQDLGSSDSDSENESAAGTSAETAKRKTKFSNAQQWAKFGNFAAGFFQKAPVFSYLYGAFSFEPVEVAARQPRQAKPRGTQESVATVQLSQMTISAEEPLEATSSQVDGVRRLLRKRCADARAAGTGPLGYFNFVVNPHSFGKTVENIFHCSFLLKDGFAKLYLDRNKLPVIEYVEKEREEAAASNRAHDSDAAKITKQFVMSFDMKIWKEIVEVFGIKTALISDAEIAALKKKQKNR